MEVTCPKCHSKTSIDALHLALSSSVVCAACGALFAVGQSETLLGSMLPPEPSPARQPQVAARAAEVSAPRAASAPEAEPFEDILVIPRGVPGGVAEASQAEVFGDLFDETRPAQSLAANSPAVAATEPVTVAHEVVTADTVVADEVVALRESVAEASEAAVAADEPVVVEQEAAASSTVEAVEAVETFEAEPPSASEPDELHTSQAPAEQASPEELEQVAPVVQVAPAVAAAPVADGYAVGMRVLRIAPAWLLLCCVGFLSVILFLSWMARPVGEVKAAQTAAEEAAAKGKSDALKNEATNQQAAPAVAQTAAAPAEQAKAEEKQEVKTAPPAAPEPSAPQVEAGASEGKFTVQVGSYADASQANGRVSGLRAAGFEARAASVELPGRGVWFRVYCGRFQTRAEAASFGAQLRSKGAASQVIIAEVEQ